MIIYVAQRTESNERFRNLHSKAKRNELFNVSKDYRMQSFLLLPH